MTFFLCILYRLRGQQQDLSPCELIKTNVWACAHTAERKSDSGELIIGEGRVKSFNE